MLHSHGLYDMLYLTILHCSKLYYSTEQFICAIAQSYCETFVLLYVTIISLNTYYVHIYMFVYSCIAHLLNIFYIWFRCHPAVKEYAFMKALHAHGFPTPTPIDQSRHIVAMSKVEGNLIFYETKHDCNRFDTA